MPPACRACIHRGSCQGSAASKGCDSLLAAVKVYVLELLAALQQRQVLVLDAHGELQVHRAQGCQRGGAALQVPQRGPRVLAAPQVEAGPQAWRLQQLAPLL